MKRLLPTFVLALFMFATSVHATTYAEAWDTETINLYLQDQAPDTMTVQIYQDKYLTDENSRDVTIVIPKGNYITTFARFSNMNNFGGDLEVWFWGNNAGDQQLIRRNYTAETYQIWYQLFPDDDISDEAMNTQVIHIDYSATTNMSLMVYNWYFVNTDFFEIASGKNRFCQPAFDETCYSHAELNQTCNDKIKQNAFANITQSYTNIIQANFGIWSHAYAVIQFFITIFIWIMLPLIVLLYLKKLIMRFVKKE